MSEPSGVEKEVIRSLSEAVRAAGEDAVSDPLFLACNDALKIPRPASPVPLASSGKEEDHSLKASAESASLLSSISQSFEVRETMTLRDLGLIPSLVLNFTCFHHRTPLLRTTFRPPP